MLKKKYYSQVAQQVKWGGRIIQLNELKQYDNILLHK